MEPYARALLRFAHAAVASRRPAGSRCSPSGTRLTRVTRELAPARPRRGPGAAAGRGGRLVGRDPPRRRACGEFNDRWGVRGMARGAVVVILSDGWDRGDPEVLAERDGPPAPGGPPGRLGQPAEGAPGYAPLARGMAAALPYVDEFVEGHSLASLEAAGRPCIAGHGDE